MEILLSKTYDPSENQNTIHEDIRPAQKGVGSKLKKRYDLRDPEASIEEVNETLNDSAFNAVRSAHSLSVQRGVVGRSVHIGDRRQVSDVVGGGDGASAALKGVAGGSVGRVFGRNYKLNRLWRSKSSGKWL